MLYGHRHQGASTFGQICPPRPWTDRKHLIMCSNTAKLLSKDQMFSFCRRSPENYEVPAGMRGHAVEDILKHLCPFVQCLTDLPLKQVHVPQVALSQHPVQHDGRRRFHLHRHSPPSQRVPISHLDEEQKHSPSC